MSSNFTVIYDACVLYPAPLRDLLNLHAARVCEAAANHRRSLKNPPKTVDEYLDTLLKQWLTQTVGQLREWKAAI